MDLSKEPRVWHVREGEHYIFHLEAPLHEDAALRDCLARADRRYLAIRRALGQGELSLKERERLGQGNYWLYGSALTDADLPPGCGSMAYGTVNAAGIAFAQRHMRWGDLSDQMTHEEIHLWWGREVGEAPSLLNEGVAVYFELLLSPRSGERTAGLWAAWRDVVVERRRSLRHLSRNAGFWEAYGQGLPVYLVGGALAGYLVEEAGLAVLRRIFGGSHYEDDRLADAIERETGRDLAVIQERVAEWLRQRRCDRVTGATG